MPFEIETQLQTRWCWAAVAASISRYYSPRNSWSQCQIASYVLGGSCCATPGDYNVNAHLQDALQLIARLRGTLRRNLSFEDIRDELLRGSPIAARIAWKGGGGHFVIVRGCRERAGMKLLNIADPFFADSIQRYDEFCNSYLGRGRWTDTFLIGSVGTGPV